MAELQYWGNTCIDVILPNEGISASECLSQLSQERFDAALSKLENKRLDLKLPKFDISYDIDLNDVMRTLGITDAFSEATADFSNMGTAVGINGDPYLSRAFQKSRISIDEDGTEAAAITVLTMEGTSAEFEPQLYVVPIEFYVNHQFIYVIREGNNILFVGKIEKM